MAEYIIKNAKVRVHGTPEPDNLKTATQKFLKKAETQRKKVRQNDRQKAHS